ncbi:MAG: DUF4293 domain-containing protein [Marinifilaceae bacterium]
MIQRIQSLFLLIVAILSGLMFAWPVADFYAMDGNVYAFYVQKVLQVNGEETVYITRNLYSMILAIIACVLPFVVIFMYKKRYAQIRLTIVEIVLQGGLLFLLWLQCNNLSAQSEILYKVPLIFPIVNVILCMLSVRRIGKDIALIKSYDRIR